MPYIKKILSAIMICLFVLACNESDKEQAAQNSTSTNAAETPLIIPDNATQTSSTNLQDIWVLDSINSKEKFIVNYVNNTPVIDFNLEKKTVSGHTGCNGLSGKLKVEGNKLIFDSLVLSSRQVCRDQGFEKKLFSGFKNGNTTYQIFNDTLHLNVGAGSVFIFRRIRR